MFRAVLVVVFLISGVSALDLSVFAPAKDDQKLHVINFKPLKDEKNHKVIIEFGQNLEVDCNSYFFTGGALERKNLQGYGYVYYSFSGGGELAGTKMACSDPKSEKFVKYGQNIDLNYNSTTPVIIYAPQNIQIRYRVFRLIDEVFVSFK